jgi:2-haloalkanoic acid dehalogenase type II
MTAGAPDEAAPLRIDGVAAVAFDCYGTLANFVEQDFVLVFDEICLQSRLPLSDRQLWDRWLEQGRVLARERGRDPQDPLAGPEPTFMPMRDIWLAQFERTFAPFGVAGRAAGARDLLVERLSDAGCYPEVAEVLQHLRAYYRLAVLSNADDDFLGACLARNELEFETVVSSESARSYKPRGPIFDRVCELLRLDAAQVLYVGDSPIADLLGARAAGMAVGWINRGRIALPENVPAPDLELTGLTALVNLLPRSAAAAAGPSPA